MELKELCLKLDLDFNKIERALTIALTHSSYGNEHHKEFNERLEYLGDAVLELCMSTYKLKIIFAHNAQIIGLLLLMHLKRY